MLSAIGVGVLLCLIVVIASFGPSIFDKHQLSQIAVADIQIRQRPVGTDSACDSNSTGWFLADAVVTDIQARQRPIGAEANSKFLSEAWTEDVHWFHVKEWSDGRTTKGKTGRKGSRKGYIQG